MKKNNKGFMLAETIIVTVIVATIMVSLYVAFNKVYSAYTLKNKYTDIDLLYAANAVQDYLIDNLNLNKIVNDNLTNEYDLVDLKDTKILSDNYCTNIFTNYNIEHMYMIKLGSELKAKDITEKLTEPNQTFIDYINYLETSGKLNDAKGKYIFLLEAKENDLYDYEYLILS